MIGGIYHTPSKPLPIWLQNALVIIIVLPAIAAMMVWTVFRPAPAKPN